MGNHWHCHHQELCTCVRSYKADHSHLAGGGKQKQVCLPLPRPLHSLSSDSLQNLYFRTNLLADWQIH